MGIQSFKLVDRKGRSIGDLEATLILFKGKYHLLKNSEIIRSYTRDIFRRTYFGKVEYVCVDKERDLVGIPFKHPKQAKEYVLGTYAKGIKWVKEEANERTISSGETKQNTRGSKQPVLVEN